jgi:hypothetical protein
LEATKKRVNKVPRRLLKILLKSSTDTGIIIKDRKAVKDRIKTYKVVFENVIDKRFKPLLKTIVAKVNRYAGKDPYTKLIGTNL